MTARRFLILVLFLSASLPAQRDPGLERLQAEMARLAAVAGGVTGATAIHLETGRRVEIHGSDRFPMASTFKVPLAVHVLRQVDAGKERLERMVALNPGDLHPGSGTLSSLFRAPGVALSIRNLLELALLISDNSAADLLMKTAGGPDAVTTTMREIGIDGIRVDRPAALLIADSAGLALPPEQDWSPEIFEKAFGELTPELRAAAREQFEQDPRDTATPNAMADLLAKIDRGELLRPETNTLLLDILVRCRTGESRIKGLLPRQTEVAHKTGTLGRSASDVGLVTLPGDAGHLALAVFVRNATGAPAQRERAIAEISRAVHDYFVFEPSGGLDYEAIAGRIVSAVRPDPGEKVFLRPDPDYFRDLLPPLRRRLRAAGAVETTNLAEATVYLWLPLRPGGPGLPPEERAAVQQWTSLGGARRQLHFHWGEGSVYPDGLYGEHTPELDRIYQSALDIDYAALAADQDRLIERLRAGIVRVRTMAGTDLRFQVGTRPFNKQDGDASARRAEAAKVRVDRDIELPAGVLRVAPVEETVEGTIFVPEMRIGEETARGVRFEIKGGKVARIVVRENLAAVNRMLEDGGDAAWRFREFAVGLNPKLGPVPGVRTVPYYGYGKSVVRLSFGDNQELGGNVKGGFVRWFFFPDAWVDVDGRPLR